MTSRSKRIAEHFMKCAKCKHEYRTYTVRRCPYSKTGKYICFWCCKRCPYVEQRGTALGCKLKKRSEKKK